MDAGAYAGGLDTWSQVEDDFFVGSRNGEFLGFVDRIGAERYLASDQYSREIGSFATLSAAINALEASRSLPDAPGKAA